jgi:hypothetical protein
MVVMAVIILLETNIKSGRVLTCGTLFRAARWRARTSWMEGLLPSAWAPAGLRSVLVGRPGKKASVGYISYWTRQNDGSEAIAASYLGPTTETKLARRRSRNAGV